MTKLLPIKNGILLPRTCNFFGLGQTGWDYLQGTTLLYSYALFQTIEFAWRLSMFEEVYLWEFSSDLCQIKSILFCVYSSVFPWSFKSVWCLEVVENRRQKSTSEIDTARNCQSPKPYCDMGHVWHLITLSFMDRIGWNKKCFTVLCA